MSGRQCIERMVDIAKTSRNGEKAGRNRNKPAFSAALVFCLRPFNVLIFSEQYVKIVTV